MSAKIIFAVGLLALLISGCRAQDLPAPQTDVFSMLYNERTAQPFQADWLILDEYKQRQNVRLDVRTGDDADYDRALIQALETGDTPDIILKVWPDQIESYATTGMLLPFSEYEQFMPHFTAYIEQHDLQVELDKLRQNDGSYYILPGYGREIQVQQWIYRQDVFVEHDLAAPTTYEELFDALVHLKEYYPDATPLTTPWGGAHLLAMMGAGYGIPAGWAGVRDFDAEENRWRYAPATNNYRELYRFLHRAYAAGILDPAFFTQSDDEFLQKVTGGQALVTVSWITSGFKHWDQKLHENGIPNGQWVPFPVPESTIGIRALPAVDPFKKGLIVPSSVINEPYFERLLKFLDWAVYSEEGMTLTAWGVEGVTYEQTSGGKALLSRQQTEATNAATQADYTAAYGLNTLFNLNENTEYEDYKKPTEIVEFLAASLQAGDASEMDPNLKLDASAIEAIRLLNEKLDPYVATASKEFITGESDIEADWDAYKLGLELRGYKTLEEIWNSAWVAQTPK